MKALFAVLTLFAANIAQAETLAVEFQPCSSNPNYQCALVYGGRRPLELTVQSSKEIAEKIERLILPHGRSLAMNIDGDIITVTKFGTGQKYKYLQVNKLEGDPSAPRPRSLPR